MRNSNKRSYDDWPGWTNFYRVAAIPLVRMALYDPCEPDDEPEFFGPLFFAGNKLDERIIRCAIKLHFKLKKPKECTGAFPYDGPIDDDLWARTIENQKITESVR